MLKDPARTGNEQTIIYETAKLGPAAIDALVAALPEIPQPAHYHLFATLSATPARALPVLQRYAFGPELADRAGAFMLWG